VTDSPNAVLWPDLARFGLQLSVAFNATCSKNFLKLALLDRQAFQENCGLSPPSDVLAILRELGFSLAGNESAARADILNTRLLRERGLNPETDFLDDADAIAVSVERAKRYFYSPSLVVRDQALRKLLPALAREDYRMLPVSDIKHLDFSPFSDNAAMTDFFQEIQRRPDSSDGTIWFTTPESRQRLSDIGDWPHAFESIANPLKASAVLQSDDTPIGQALSIKGVNTLERMGRLPIVSRMMRSPTQDSAGIAIKAPIASAMTLGYLNESDAVEANGGTLDGIQRTELPYAFPIAVDRTGKQILVIRDGRCVEFESDFASHSGLHEFGLARVLDVRGTLFTARDRYQALHESGKLDPAQWDNSNQVRQIRADLGACIEALPKGEAMYADEPLPLNSIEWLHGFAGNGVGLASEGVTEAYGKPFLEFYRDHSEILSAIDARLGELVAVQARNQGQQKAVQQVQSADPAQGRREDAGEKIGGARKDYAKRWLSVDELSGLTLREMNDVVTKDNIWPSPDWASWEEKGVPANVAYLVRELRGALPVNPYRGGFNCNRSCLRQRANEELTLARCAAFIQSVELARDKFAGVVDVESFVRAAFEIRRDASVSGTYSEYGSLAKWFEDGAGYNFTHKALPSIEISGMDSNGKLILTTGYSTDLLLYRANSKIKGTYDWAAKKTRTVLDDGGKKEKVEPVYPHLEHIERIGPDYRHEKDVDEALLLEVFGFRGVEYGNWLPQDERQSVLNHAFDAFMDLSTALKLPPKAMGLQGSGDALAIAFGARGRGGKSAALAHYEPGRNVINLTRLSGAGALAHEWGHAFDFWLAKRAGVSSTRALTQIQSQRSCSTIQLPMLKAFIKNVDDLHLRPQPFNEYISVLIDSKRAPGSTFVEKARSDLAVWLRALDRMLPEERREGLFLKSAEDQISGCFIPVAGFEEFGVCRLHGMRDVITSLKTSLDVVLGKEWHDRFYQGEDYPEKYQDWLNQRVDFVEQKAAEYSAVNTFAQSRFVADAAVYDSVRSKPYWSTKIELFARSFEAWVQDTIEHKPGLCSQYLVHGRNDNVDATLSAYPRGEERQRFNASLEAFFESYRPMLTSMLIEKSELENLAEPA